MTSFFAQEKQQELAAGRKRSLLLRYLRSQPQFLRLGPAAFFYLTYP